MGAGAGSGIGEVPATDVSPEPPQAVNPKTQFAMTSVSAVRPDARFMSCVPFIRTVCLFFILNGPQSWAGEIPHIVDQIAHFDQPQSRSLKQHAHCSNFVRFIERCHSRDRDALDRCFGHDPHASNRSADAQQQSACLALTSVGKSELLLYRAVLRDATSTSSLRDPGFGGYVMRSAASHFR
jgi:hypothetical protein